MNKHDLELLLVITSALAVVACAREPRQFASPEIMARRLGRNELAAILVSLAYVDAQFEYATQPRQQPGLLEYAQKFMSTQGRRDGLYWQETPDQAQSPMGPLLAAAQHEGYTGSGQRPYHGYYYRILKAQGEHATDGAYDYVVNDHMIGGFALLAYPANYGNSGVMSFIVNHRGVVYEKDLGPDTDRQASALQRFDPDPSWQPVNEQLLSSLQL